MPVPRRRHCKSRRDKRRTHDKMHPRQTVKCPNPECDGPRLPHRACPKCGQYKGREYKTTVVAS